MARASCRGVGAASAGPRRPWKCAADPSPGLPADPPPCGQHGSPGPQWALHAQPCFPRRSHIMPVRAANAHLASRSGGEDGPLRLAFDIPPKQPPRALAPVNTVLVEKSNQPKCHGAEGRVSPSQCHCIYGARASLKARVGGSQRLTLGTVAAARRRPSPFPALPHSDQPRWPRRASACTSERVCTNLARKCQSALAVAPSASRAAAAAAACASNNGE